MAVCPSKHNNSVCLAKVPECSVYIHVTLAALRVTNLVRQEKRKKSDDYMV